LLAPAASTAASTAAILELSRRDAVVELSRHLHRIDPRDRAMLDRELDLLAELVRRVRVARLRLGHRYDGMDVVGELILADVAG
jgi:hypothetical protein